MKVVKRINKFAFLRKVKPFHVDERGEMSHLLAVKTPITSAVLITCKKGAIRANHYHKTDTHYSYMLKGKMAYYYRKLNAKDKKIHKVIVREGDIVYTPPKTLHAMEFLEDSIFIALSTEPRNQEAYEKGTVRVKLI